jgi:hypothetical protein
MSANTIDEAIYQAMVALGGVATTAQVHDWIERNYPGRWRDISTPMRNLAIPRLPSSSYAPGDLFLEKIGHGRYRLLANPEQRPPGGQQA